MQVIDKTSRQMYYLILFPIKTVKIYILILVCAWDEQLVKYAKHLVHIVGMRKK